LITATLLACTAATRPASSTAFHLVEFTPWLAGSCARDRTQGVVYLVLGWNRRPVLDRTRLAPYLVKALSENCWEVIAAKAPEAWPNQESFETGRHLRELAVRTSNRTGSGSSWATSARS
jgi:hypothetical protein